MRLLFYTGDLTHLSYNLLIKKKTNFLSFIHKKKVFDVYQQCGDDMNAYLNQMREDIAEINFSRQERNLQPLPELLHHPADVAEAEDATHKNESEGEIRKPVYRYFFILFNQLKLSKHLTLIFSKFCYLTL